MSRRTFCARSISADRQAAALPHLVFIHIGKTAGTSLRKVVQDAFGAAACSEPFVQSYMSEADANHYRAFPAICGHISRADQLRWFPDRAVITILREPIDRGLSFLHYVRSLPADAAPIAADAKRLPMLELIETEKAQRNLHNTMVRQLGGHMLDAPTDFAALFEAAQETLCTAFWVGRQNRLGADLACLAARLGVSLASRDDNVTPGRPAIDADDRKVIARLWELSDWDRRLWAWACARD